MTKFSTSCGEKLTMFIRLIHRLWITGKIPIFQHFKLLLKVEKSVSLKKENNSPISGCL